MKKSIAEIIVDYLNEHGRRSCKNIRDDLGVSQFDIDKAIDDGEISEANAPVDGENFIWYVIAMPDEFTDEEVEGSIDGW